MCIYVVITLGRRYSISPCLLGKQSMHLKCDLLPIYFLIQVYSCEYDIQNITEAKLAQSSGIFIRAPAILRVYLFSCYFPYCCRVLICAKNLL